MIKDVREYEVAVWIRQNILDLVAGVKNASSLWWNDSSANSLTQRKIKQLEAEFLSKLAELGMLVVREHAPCGDRKHEDLALHSLISNNYWRLELPDGRTDAHTVEDGVLFFDGVKMAHTEPRQWVATEPCPCRLNKAVEHTIASYEAWPDAPQTRLNVLVECLHILRDAEHRSGSKMPRAAIREKLLCCLILLNEAIAPVSAAEHLAARNSGTDTVEAV